MQPFKGLPLFTHSLNLTDSHGTKKVANGNARHNSVQYMVEIPKDSTHIVLSGEAFNKLTTSIVYIWRRGNEVLYIGTSIAGLGRFANHHVLNVKEAVLDNDIIDIYWLPTKEARELECSLIREHKTKYNINRYDGNATFNEKLDGHDKLLNQIMSKAKS